MTSSWYAIYGSAVMVVLRAMLDFTKIDNLLWEWIISLSETLIVFILVKTDGRIGIRIIDLYHRCPIKQLASVILLLLFYYKKEVLL